MPNTETDSAIAFFDFDGTITTRDSLWLFLKYFSGNLIFYLKLISLIPALGLFKVGVINSKNMKESVFKKFLKNCDLVVFEQKCELFTKEILVNYLRSEALRKIKWHRERGHQIVVVSASPMNWLKYWCEDINIDLIGTKLEVYDNKLSGQIDGENCKGLQKVTQIKQKYDLSKYNMVYAYGDTNGDKEMLELADKAFYRRFN
ncbi:HAD-IB family hydrolase [uncultured Marivirga sp.]|uniref:HAD-IB family hydrolase n=1 Tax=uncultured Marivirga sp. TaxID=1123707 RepID=UPI0030ED4477|tara:strand:- start:8151 stop:8759 length:609 start_codon:yes stop_codon:yes gene_type:complete